MPAYSGQPVVASVTVPETTTIAAGVSGMFNVVVVPDTTDTLPISAI